MTGRFGAVVLRGVMACLLPFACATVAQAAGVFRTDVIDGIRVVVDAEWPGQLGPGYVPVRFEFTNLGDPRTIRIVGEGTRSLNPPRMRGGPRATIRFGRTRIEQDLALARDARVRVTWAVPIVGSNESLRLHLWDGERRLGDLGSFNVSGTVDATNASVLIVATTGSALAERAQRWLRAVRLPGYFVPAVATGVAAAGGGPTTVPGGSRAVPVPPRADMMLSPERLPSTWLGYPSLRAVAIGADAWTALDDAQRTALRTWVAAGGDLLMMDGTPDLAVSSLFGSVHHMRSEEIADEAAFDAVLSGLPSTGRDEWRLPANRASDWDQVSRNFRLPIPGVGEVRAGSFLVILALFAFVVGPINYLVLQRWRRPALLVVTAPLISIAFVFLLGAYVVAGEGFGVHSRITSLTMLDQAAQQAATRAIVSMYAAGRAPSGGVAFARDTAVLPIVAAGVPDVVEMDVAGGQRYSSGLLRARTPASFEVVNAGPARQRLVVTRTGDGALEVVNGLGAAMTSLVVRDRDGTYTLPAAVAAGGKAVLRRGSEPPSLVPPEHPAFLRLAQVRTERPGSYIATLAASPFVDVGSARLQEHDSVHVVLGRLESLP